MFMSTQTENTRLIILKKYCTNESPFSSHTVKLKLIACGEKQWICERCHRTTWNDQPIPIELHHIDGNKRNNLIENLQILCNNCHAQTESFRRKKSNSSSKISKTIEEYKNAIVSSPNMRQALIKLGISPRGGNYLRARTIMNDQGLSFRPYTEEEKKVYRANLNKASRTRRLVFEGNMRKIYNRRSIKEWGIENRKVVRPSKDELLHMIWSKSAEKIAKTYGISSSAVKKWAKVYQIPTPPPGYWRKFECGHLAECDRIKASLFSKYMVVVPGLEPGSISA